MEILSPKIFKQEIQDKWLRPCIPHGQLPRVRQPETNVKVNILSRTKVAVAVDLAIGSFSKKTTTATATAATSIKTKGLMSGTIAVHVHYNSWYIPLPSSEKQQRETTKFCVAWRT